MKKSVKIGFPIVCVGVIVVTFGMMADIKKKAEARNKEIEIDNSIIEEDNIDTAIEILKAEVYDNKNNSNIYFTSEGIEDGKYIIAVRDNDTTEAKQYYIIDLENEEVEIYY